MNPGILSLTLAAVALFGGIVLIFNRLVRDRNLVRAGLSDIDVQLQRRHDLVPRLVEAVKGYAGFERSLLERVTEVRGRASRAEGVDERDHQEAELAEGISRLVLLAEDYPDLKASENFRQLVDELVETEDLLQHARRYYNGAVRQFNTRVQQFPDLLVARALHFREAAFFSAAIEARVTPSVTGLNHA